MTPSRLVGIFSFIATLMVPPESFASQCGRPVRIMPLGDSITAGVNRQPSSPHTAANGYIVPEYRVGYRQQLYLNLLAGNHDVDFVGSKNDGLSASIEGPAFDSDHQGTPGITDTAVAQNIYAWIVAAKPDIVLLHIGTNGLTTDTAADVEKILNEIDRYDQHIEVIVAQIIGQDPAGANLLVEPFNANVATLIQQRKAAGDRVELLNMNSKLNYPADLSDTLHPNIAGYNKMANAWMAVLGPKINARCSGKPEFITTPKLWAAQGQAYQYQADVKGQGAVTYSLTTKPAGMNINANNGLINWNPSTSGNQQVTVKAVGPQGTATQSYTLEVIDGIVVDNDDVGTSSSGVWQLDKSADIYGSDALVEKGANNKSYTFLVPASGKKEVYLWWTANNGRAGNVPVEVYNGTETPANRVHSDILDQRNNGGKWNKLGEFNFSGNARVILRGVAGSKYTSADAVRIMTAAGSSQSKPSITSTALTEVLKGQAYSYDVNATGSPAAQYSIQNPPAGMTINPNNGVISWSPLNVGDFPVTVIASNSAGQASQNFSIHVTENSPAPSNVTEIIDNNDAEFTAEGGWEEIDSGYAGSSLRALGTGKKASFQRNGITGKHEISLWWKVSQSWARNVPVRIYDGANSTPLATMTIDQVQGGGDWYSLGSFNFNDGVRVEVQAENHEWRRTVVDALRIRPDGTVSSDPVIYSSPIRNAKVGELYKYEIDSNAESFSTWQLVTAPAGMTLNSQQKTINWIPAEVGDFFVTVRLTSNGKSTSQNYKITVTGNSISDSTETVIILDDKDNKTFSVTGAYETVLGGSVYDGQSRLSNDPNGKFIFESQPITGKYSVSMSWLGGQNRARSVPVKIMDGSTTLKELIIDQRTLGDVWHFLGRYDFQDRARIELGRDGSWRSTSGDAVMLQPN